MDIFDLIIPSKFIMRENKKSRKGKVTSEVYKYLSVK